MGRQRETNALVLRCPLADDPTGQKTERLSRQHAALEFTADGLVWRDLDTLNGRTLVYPTGETHHLARGQQAPVRGGTVVTAARAISLTAHLSRDNHVRATGEEH